MIKQLTFIIFFFWYISSNAQFFIKGFVYDDLGFELQNVNVVVTKVGSTNILGYTISNKKGFYSIEIPASDSLQIKFTHIGYSAETKAFLPGLNSFSKDLNLNVQLFPTSITLDEVIVNDIRSIKVSKDTISILSANYALGNERSVEDLLKKIPGIEVSSSGVIKVGNQEIEKLMVDGDDFFEKGYRVLSKNMPAYAIDEIQILKNFSNNSLLKNIESSDKVALNLKLKENAKRVWFGNLNMAFGLTTENRYNLKGNLMNFGKKNKYYFLTSLNNVGEDVLGDIDALIQPFRVNEPTSIGDNQRLFSPIKMQKEVINIEESRTNYNNSELVSLNAIFNPTDKLKIKSIVFFNWDEKDFFKDRIDQINVNQTNFINTEIYRLKNIEQRLFSKLDLTYNLSSTQRLEAISKISKGTFTDRSAVIFNDDANAERLTQENSLFDQKVSYIDKFQARKVFLITGRFIKEQRPQLYQADYTFNNEFFSGFPDTDNFLQSINTHFQFSGIEAQIIDRKENNDLLDLQLGNEFRKDILTSSLSLQQGDTLLTNPIDFQNNISYSVNDLYLKIKYKLGLDNISLTGELGFHQLFNNLTDTNNDENDFQHPFFVNPSIGLEWQINSNNKTNASYSYNTTNAKSQEIYGNYILSRYRNFIKGTGSFNQLAASTFVVNYQLGNWTDRFFINSFLVYTKNHDFFSTNNIIDQSITLTEKILIKDREYLSLESTLDYFMEEISSNIKMKLGYTQSNYKNFVNGSNLRNIHFRSYDVGLELRSGFSGIFNYHIGSKFITNRIESATLNKFKGNESFLNVFFSINKAINLDINAERFFIENMDQSNTYYFLDLNSKYKFQNDRWILGISAKNLFNTNTFQNVSISDIGTSLIQYRLLPRFILLQLEYRF